MKTLKKMTLLFLLFFPFITGCHKDTIQPNKAATEYFPNTVGDYWEYDVYDSSGVQQHPTISKNYTVKVSIIGTKKLVDNQDATVWQYEYPWGNELNYIRISGDTVKIYDSIRIQTFRGLQFPLEVYVMPLQGGQHWNGKLLWVDNYTVTNVASVFTGGNTFDSCFMIFRNYEGPNMEYNDSFWFKRKIGFIKKYKHEYNLGPKDIELWQLKKYSLH